MRRYHRLTGDGTTLACGTPYPHAGPLECYHGDDQPLAGRTAGYLRAFLGRHPDVTPCQRCFPDEPVPESIRINPA